MKLTRIAAACACIVSMTTAHAEGSAPQSLADALTQGTSLSSFRLRDEYVEQDAKAKNANALTLRTLLGWQTAPLHGFSVGLQLINVGKLDTNYNDSALVTNSPYPLVADPDYTGVNQAYLDWTGISDTRVRLGRQSVKLDNVRFVGNVEFRQVMQVFDGVSVESRALQKDTTLYAAHFNAVTQVSTLKQDTDIHIVNLRHALSPTENLVGYGYFVGWDVQTPQLQSSRTLGVRLEGARPLAKDWKLLYTAEYAKQDPYKTGDPNIDSHYARLGVGAKWGEWFARVDHERLSSNKGLTAFQTPLGTNHLFQGWVDKFLSTPKPGIRDTCLTAGTKLGKFTLLTEYHWFDSDVAYSSGAGTATHYGKEWDVALAYPFSKQLVGKVEYGSFREGQPYTAAATSRVRDTDKLWVTAMYSF